MFTRLRSIRPIDAAIIAVAVILLFVSAFLGWSMWSQKRQVTQATPVARAIAELEDTVRKKPNDVDLRLQLAQAYNVSGLIDKATTQYLQVLKIQKNNIGALTGLGFVASRERQWEKAEGYWRRAIKIMNKQPGAKVSKSYETANFYLGNALLEQKKYEDAIGYFKEALRVNRTASDTHFLLAYAYKGIGADDQYKSELEFALAFDPLMPEANFEYGKLLKAAGDDATAAQHFRVAADAAPTRPEPREELKKLGPFKERMAKATELSGSDPKKALIEVRVAVALEPRDVGALKLLGQLYEKTKNKTAAVDAYKKILSLEPNNEDAQTALNRVNNGK